MIRKLGLDSLTFSSNKKSRIAGGLTTFAALLLLWFFRGAFYDASLVGNPGVSSAWTAPLPLLWCVLSALALGLAICFRPQWRADEGDPTVAARSESLRRKFVLALYILLPVFSLTMMEYLGGVFTYDWSPLTLLRNYTFAALLYLGVYVVTNSIRVPVFAVNILFYVFGVVNHYVAAFRGTPFLPTDIAALKTGLSVAGNYDYTPDQYLLLGTLLFALILAVAGRIQPVALPKLVRRTIKGVSAGLILLFCTLLYQTDWFANNGMQPDFFNQSRGYRNHGSLFHFWINTKYLTVDPPDGYSSERVPEIVGPTEPVEPTEPKHQTLPNVICIMNETLSDLSVVGEFTTNMDYMPYLRSLSDNTVKGDLYVSVYGAGTANSEFEFLTGDSLAFLPAGSCAYESYVDAPMPSLVSSLGTLGYSKTAFHPYYGENWQRQRVYPLLGFERYLDISDLVGAENVTQYREDGNFWRYENQANELHPDQNVFLRRYISDEFDFRKIESLYEERDESRPFFLFNVTMQNHSSYDMVSANFEPEVYLTSDMAGKYPKTDQYLSLLKYTDDAFQQLTAYFSQVDEPTVICIFGDHQPSIEPEFYEALYGKPLADRTLEETQRQYQTPFVIWANYEIEAQEIEAISANYLSTLLMETAGLPLTDYQQYLSDLRKTIPVINSNGYLGADGVWYQVRDKESPYYEVVADYDKVQYNNLFDTENRVEDLYVLKNVPMTEEEP